MYWGNNEQNEIPIWKNISKASHAEICLIFTWCESRETNCTLMTEIIISLRVQFRDLRQRGNSSVTCRQMPTPCVYAFVLCHNAGNWNMTRVYANEHTKRTKNFVHAQQKALFICLHVFWNYTLRWKNSNIQKVVNHIWQAV